MAWPRDVSFGSTAQGGVALRPGVCVPSWVPRQLEPATGVPVPAFLWGSPRGAAYRGGKSPRVAVGRRARSAPRGGSERDCSWELG